MKKIFFLIILLASLILIPNTLAFQKTGHIYLLAVSSGNEENATGSVADLYLEIKDGTGRVFLDTVPLTKVDTQFSTRFANNAACEYLEIDCRKYDFFYTIRSQSSIVGGPSAGAAITLLTISTLSDKSLPNELAVTGTINAGGIIGPVGGVKAKVKAAELDKLKKVVIPTIEVGNTTELEAFLNFTSIEVIRASSVDEALYKLTGVKKKTYPNISQDLRFVEIMGEISKTLCSATEKIKTNKTNTSEEIKGNELYLRSINATLNKAYYAAASYCFGANVQFRMLDLKNKSNDELFVIYLNIKNDINNFEKNIDSINLKTIDDLQTYIIVKERINEAKEYLDTIEKIKNFSNISSNSLAYSIERYNSAITWSSFFGSGVKEYKIDKIVLKQVCIEKISEVENYLQYITLYADLPLENTNKILKRANEYLHNEEYELCISDASKAKAESFLILEALSVSHDNMKELLPEKFEVAKQTIIKAQQKGVFPILGYSYYEYALNLKEHDADSSLVYVMYSIEMSNLDAYFEKKNDVFTAPSFQIDYYPIIMLTLGMFIGIMATLIAFRKDIFYTPKWKKKYK